MGHAYIHKLHHTAFHLLRANEIRCLYIKKFAATPARSEQRKHLYCICLFKSIIESPVFLFQAACSKIVN